LEKIKIKTKIGVIFHIFAQTYPYGRLDVINCAKFYRNRSRGFDSVRGRSLTIPFGLRCRRFCDGPPCIYENIDNI